MLCLGMSDQRKNRHHGDGIAKLDGVCKLSRACAPPEAARVNFSSHPLHVLLTQLVPFAAFRVGKNTLHHPALREDIDILLDFSCSNQAGNTVHPFLYGLPVIPLLSENKLTEILLIPRVLVPKHIVEEIQLICKVRVEASSRNSGILDHAVDGCVFEGNPCKFMSCCL